MHLGIQARLRRLAASEMNRRLTTTALAWRDNLFSTRARPILYGPGEYVFHVFRLCSVCSGNVPWLAEVLGATGSRPTSD